MPQSLSQSFTIHPVGQGFFYTCNIKPSNSNTPFRFVFDCGSLNKKSAEDEVDEYLKQNFPDKKENLDLLIVSHFDEDHINFLPRLLKDVKVKKIITPFISMEERLVLALRVKANKSRSEMNQINERTIFDILDPNSLLKYLGEGGELITIESDPENPPFNIEEENNSNPIKETISSDPIFNFSSRSRISKKQTAKTDTIKDSSKGILTDKGIPIMEFLFYRKQIGSDDTKFFEQVYKLFLRDHADDFLKSTLPTIDELINVVKKINSAKKIKDIFREAAKAVKGISISLSKLTDMNTTALCLLHHNPKNLFRKIIDEAEATKQSINTLAFATIVKNVGIKSTLTEPLVTKTWLNIHELNTPFNISMMPNTMLTSDSFLLNGKDVDAFKKRYEQYWNKFWLFQLPHHGAERNTDLTLLKLVPDYVFSFINYGIQKTWGGNWRHPSPKLMENLMMTNLQLAFLKINENTGLKFHYLINLY